MENYEMISDDELKELADRYGVEISNRDRTISNILENEMKMLFSLPIPQLKIEDKYKPYVDDFVSDRKPNIFYRIENGIWDNPHMKDGDIYIRSPKGDINYFPYIPLESLPVEFCKPDSPINIFYDHISTILIESWLHFNELNESRDVTFIKVITKHNPLSGAEISECAKLKALVTKYKEYYINLTNVENIQMKHYKLGNVKTKLSEKLTGLIIKYKALLTELTGWVRESRWTLFDYRHDFIQILFPLTTPGVANREFTLTFPEIEELTKNSEFKILMRRGFTIMMEFYGINHKTGKPEFNALDRYDTYFVKGGTNGHNYLRITRMLKSLELFGLTEEQEILSKAVRDIIERPEISKKTKEIWQSTII